HVRLQIGIRGAQEELLGGAGEDAEPARAQHRLDARGVRGPPVRGVVGESVLDERQLGPGGGPEGSAVPEVQIPGGVEVGGSRSAQGLHDEQLSGAAPAAAEPTRRAAEVMETTAAAPDAPGPTPVPAAL